MKPKLNTTPDGGLACAYGTPWLDHFTPPVGTGKGCAACELRSRDLSPAAFAEALQQLKLQTDASYRQAELPWRS